MNKDKRPTQPQTFPQRGKQYTALFDLQDFLEKEVQDASPGAFYRSFTPITDGLGLESPKQTARVEAKEPEEGVTKSAMTAQQAPKRTERRMDISMLFDEPTFMLENDKVPKVSDILTMQNTPPSNPVVAARKSNATSGIPVSAILESMAPKTLGNEADLRSVMTDPRREAATEAALESTGAVGTSTKMPPKLPKATGSKRLLAMLVDQLFVITLWAIAIVITSNALNGFQSGFSIDLLKDFSNPAFQRFAVLEFAALWIGYFAVSLGILDLTFGMWVWGLRVSYGDLNDSQYWMRRMMRVIWSFFFFAPILPSILLAFRRKGRNLLDVLSGTNLYVAA